MNLPNMKDARVRNKSKIEYIYQDNIINKELYQVSTAVSEGAIAAVSLNKELNVR